MTKDLSKEDFFSLVCLKVGSNATPKQAEKYYNAVMETILAELSLNSRIKIPILGIFSLRNIGGYDMKVCDRDGTMKLRAVKKRFGMIFKPSAHFLRAINDNNFELDKNEPKKRVNAKHLVHVERPKKEKANAKDIIFARKNKELRLKRIEELKEMENNNNNETQI